MKIVFFILAFVPVLLVAQDFPDSLSWKIEFQGFNDAKSPKFRSDIPPQGKSFIIYGNPNQLSSVNKMINEKVKEYDPEEHVAVKMTFATTNVVLRDTMKAAKVKKFFNKHSILLSDCEVFNYAPPEWTNPFQYNNQLGIKSDIDKTIPPAQGKGSLKMQGKKYPNNYYVCSLIRWFYTSPVSTQANIYIPTTNPQEIWMLLYVYGTEDTSAFFNLLISEMGDDGGTNNLNARNIYTYTLPLKFKGWKQVAIRYSDLIPTRSRDVNSNQTMGNIGDRKMRPDNIKSIQYTLASKTNDKEVAMNIDNLMILYNK